MAKKQKIERSFRVPVEIETEILSRLPVKSLLRFKCVKKSWRDLIEDPTFITMHLNCFGKNSDEFVIHTSYSHKYFNQYHRGRDSDDNIVCRTEVLMPTKWLFGKSQAYLVGSCNGLICLSNNLFYLRHDNMLKIHIWNPCTRKTMELPRCDGGDDKYFVLGFGFCPKLNDYKVVKLIASYPDFPSYEVQVYSLSTDSWKKITIANPGWFLLPKLHLNMFNNGAPHWLGQAPRWLGGGIQSDSDRLLIMSFKFDDEVFQEINLPNHPDFRDPIVGFWKFLWKGSITEYRGLFSLIIQRVESEATVFYVWVMKEYGVADSWVKQFTIEIPILQDLPRFEQIINFQPIMNFENSGEHLLILKYMNRTIVWYNMKTMQIEEGHELLMLHGQAIRCKESLVSLPREISTKLLEE